MYAVKSIAKYVILRTTRAKYFLVDWDDRLFEAGAIYLAHTKIQDLVTWGTLMIKTYFFSKLWPWPLCSSFAMPDALVCNTASTGKGRKLKRNCDYDVSNQYVKKTRTPLISMTTRRLRTVSLWWNISQLCNEDGKTPFSPLNVWCFPLNTFTILGHK